MAFRVRKKKPSRARTASNGAGEELSGLWEERTLHIGGKNGLSFWVRGPLPFTALPADEMSRTREVPRIRIIFRRIIPFT